MWEGLLSIADPGCPQDPSHGGKPAQVSSLPAKLQPAEQPEDSPTDAHRPQALRVQPVP